MAVVGLILQSTVLTALWTAQVQLPGTQPNELTLGPEPSSICGCHESFDPMNSWEPGQSYRATLMALAGRDPLFKAALKIANDDRPTLTDLCLRCHVPMAWLNGRSEPGDGSLLIPEDLESVTCDICHRMIPTPDGDQLVGSGQFHLSPTTTKRSRRGSAPFGGHGVERSDFTASSALCGTCHSLFNPAENAHDEEGNDLGFVYYEQRTYEEWVDSAFPAQGIGCIECHMRTEVGAAVRGGEVYDDLKVHSFVGGNEFAVQAVRLLNPQLPIAQDVSQVGRWVDESLKEAAELEIRSPAVTVESDGTYTVDVRLTNKTGHKLPTGYPEGRRVYLEVSLDIPGQGAQILSGAWDQASGNVIRDPQFRSYETDHGRYENGVSTRTRHLILMNQILDDTRLPPEGFMPTFADMVPIGRDYGMPPYRHWDDVQYSFTAPTVAQQTQGTLRVRAMYQATDGEVVQFLIDETQGSQEAADLEMVWEALAHAPPKEMVVAEIPITITERTTLPDMGVSMMMDAGMSSTDAGQIDLGGGGGCKCSAQHAASNDFRGLALLALLGIALLRKRSS